MCVCPSVLLTICCKWMPTFTGGAGCFKSGYLTSSLPGRVHLVNVSNVVFRSTHVHKGCFVLEPALILGRYGPYVDIVCDKVMVYYDPDRDHIICSTTQLPLCYKKGLPQPPV